MLERHIDIYGRPPRQMAADGGYASGGNLKAAQGKGRQGHGVPQEARAEDRRHGQEPWVYRKLRNFRAGIEAGISCLKRPMAWRAAPGRACPLQGLRLVLGGGLQPGALRTPQAGIARLTTARDIKTGRRPALDHVRILPRTPTATTTYYHVGKIPSLEIKNCTNPAPAACGQPKTPAKHPVYGRTLARPGPATICEFLVPRI